MQYLSTQRAPVTTRFLALHLKVSWHTVQQYCHELYRKGKLEQFSSSGFYYWSRKTLNAKDPLPKKPAQPSLSFSSDSSLNSSLQEKILSLLDREIDRDIDAELDAELDTQIARLRQEIKQLEERKRKRQNEFSEKEEQKKEQERVHHEK